MSAGYSNARPRKGLAIASLVAGIVSIPTLGLLVVGAVTGVVLGAGALSRVNKNPMGYAGKGMAIAGIITSAVSLVIAAIIGVLAAIALPKLQENIKLGGETAAIKTLADRASDSAGWRGFILCEDGIVRFIESKTRGTVRRGEGTPMNQGR